MRNGIKVFLWIWVFALVAMGAASCRKPVGELPEDTSELSSVFMEGYKGFYVLNNGGKGSNKATLDYFDASKGEYQRNIYAQRNKQNPSMGDDATDMAYFNDFLYVVLRGSHKVVKLEPDGTYRDELRVNECEKLIFYEGKGYVTSLRKENIPLNQPPYGEVICFDPNTMKVLKRGTVGCQPAGLTVGGKAGNEMLYVANSGRYRNEGFDNTVSVVVPEGLDVVETFTVGLNPSKLCVDNLGNYLTTLALGDYNMRPSSVGRVQLSDGTPGDKGERDNKVLRALHPLDMMMVKSSIYCLTVEKVKESGWNGAPGLWSFSANFVGEPQEVLKAEVLSEIQNAAGFFVHPEEKSVYVFDARNFTSSGTVYCFSKEGKKLEWKIRAGIQPVCMEFVKQ